MLSFNKLSIRIGGRLLIDNASVQLPANGHVGFVGRNGTGKSTLLKAILGEVQLEAGAIRHRSRDRIGSVAQEAPTGTITPLEHVLAANVERTHLLKELEKTSDGTRVATIHERLNDISAHAAPARVSQILAGLGFDEAAQNRPLKSFSGGWRMRVALAAGLFSQPDFLLLDEPTNHLDLEASLWLERFLARYPNGLILVSHDRDLLEHACDGILHLDAAQLAYYTGNFEQFERTRRDKLAQQQTAYMRQQAERKHIQAFIDRFRYKASKARQAQSRIKMLKRMEPIAGVTGEATAHFEFPCPDVLAPPILVLEGAAVGYDGSVPVLQGLDLRIDMDDRIALLGANGNGKTTLLRLLAGELVATAGELRKSAKLKIGYFAQDQFDQLDPNLTAFRHLATKIPGAADAKVRAHLGRFGLEQTKADTRIGELSGGERTRLNLATITTLTPHLLLLDEPTNHLDIDAREALLQALNAFEGAVVLVSHDPHLVSMVADQLWLVKDGGCELFDGDVADYRHSILENTRETRREEKRINRNAPVSKRENRRKRAEDRAAKASLRRAVHDAEKRMESIAAEREALAGKLADPLIYEGPTADLANLAILKADLDQKLESAETDWLEAQEALEAET